MLNNDYYYYSDITILRVKHYKCFVLWLDERVQQEMGCEKISTNGEGRGRSNYDLLQQGRVSPWVVYRSVSLSVQPIWLTQLTNPILFNIINTKNTAALVISWSKHLTTGDRALPVCHLSSRRLHHCQYSSGDWRQRFSHARTLPLNVEQIFRTLLR